MNGKNRRGENYCFDKCSCTSAWSDKWNRSTLTFQLLTNIIRIQLQESVIVVEEGYEKYVKWKIEGAYNKNSSYRKCINSRWDKTLRAAQHERLHFNVWHKKCLDFFTHSYKQFLNRSFIMHEMQAYISKI